MSPLYLYHLYHITSNTMSLLHNHPHTTWGKYMRILLMYYGHHTIPLDHATAVPGTINTIHHTQAGVPARTWPLNTEETLQKKGWTSFQNSWVSCVAGARQSNISSRRSSSISMPGAIMTALR